MYDANARKRDDEELKLEKMKTVDKYFDKWSKITSRSGIFEVHIIMKCHPIKGITN